MKRFLLSFALNVAIANALMLPSIENPAVWNDNFAVPEGRNNLYFRYSEPFPQFYNAKIDGGISRGKHKVFAGFGSAVLDSIYRELEFSGFYAYSPFDFLTFKLSETANTEWVPEYDSWWEHRVRIAGEVSGEWLAASGGMKMKFARKEEVKFSGLLAVALNFPTYSLRLDVPILESEAGQKIYCLLSQKIFLGVFEVYNSFSVPGFALGLGAALSFSKVAFAVSHYRNAYDKGHTGVGMGFFPH